MSAGPSSKTDALNEAFRMTLLTGGPRPTFFECMLANLNTLGYTVVEMPPITVAWTEPPCAWTETP